MVLAGGALILSYAVAILAWLMLRKAGAFTPAGAGAWGVAVIACSSLVFFAERPALRALTFICGGLVGLRVYSYCLAGRPAGLADFLRFLWVGMLSPHLLFSPARPSSVRASLPRELLRMTIAGGAIAVACRLTMQLIFEGPGRHGWLVNHLILVVAFVIVMTAFGQASLALWRLMGLRARPVMDRLWLARTPADFCRRWSWPIHLWLYQYSYLPCGGRRRAVGSVLAVFAFSGILIVADVVTSARTAAVNAVATVRAITAARAAGVTSRCSRRRPRSRSRGVQRPSARPPQLSIFVRQTGGRPERDQ